MAKSTPTTQDFVTIRDIKDGIVILKSGQMCKVLLASSVNFALKSRDEQEAILLQFQNFLNTIDFSLQIYVQSRRLNIAPYLAVLAEREGSQDNDLMRIQLREYMNFINTFMTEVEVMTKNFFVVIPYTPSPIKMGQTLTNLFTPKTRSLRNDAVLEEETMQLDQRLAVVEEGLNRIGVRTIALAQDELVELFYHIFNPSDRTGSAPVVQA